MSKLIGFKKTKRRNINTLKKKSVQFCSSKAGMRRKNSDIKEILQDKPKKNENDIHPEIVTQNLEEIVKCIESPSNDRASMI